MRIAIVSELYLGGVHGVARMLFEVIGHLRARGHEIAFFAPKGGVSEYCGIQVEEYPGISVPIYPELTAAIPRRDLKTKLEAFGPEVVHLVHPIWFAARGLYYASELGLPTVASFHSFVDVYAGYYPVTRPLKGAIWEYTKYIFSQADLVLCPSKSAQDELCHKGLQSTRVWGRGVSTDSFSSDYRDPQLRRQFLGVSKSQMLLYVGRLAKEKNVEFLSRVAREIPEARLVIVGDGPNRKRLESLFAGTGTVFTGYLRGEPLSRVIASADAFVFPSTTETFGQVVCEAMASGVPVVAFDGLATRDLIENGTSGLLSRNETIFVEHVRELISDSQLRRRLIAGGLNSVRDRSWGSVTEQLVGYYQLAIDTHRAPSKVSECGPVRTPRVFASAAADELVTPRYVRVGEEELHYRRVGNGSPLILLHGAAESWQIWQIIMPILATQHTVLALDLPGCGASSKSGKEMAVEGQVACLAGFITILGLAPVSLVAHSLGVAIAMTLAKERPGLVRHLALIGGGFRLNRPYRWGVRAFANAFGYLFRLAHTDHLFASLARPFLRLIGDTPSEFVISQLQVGVASISIPTLRAVVISQLRNNPAAILDQVRCPATIIYGERDLLRRMSAPRVPMDEVVIVLDSGHFVMMEQPNDLARVILSCMETSTPR